MFTQNTKSYIVLYFLLFLCHAGVCSGSTLVNFQELDPDAAGESGKKIIVSFTAEWCQPCNVIESSLYNDHEIADLINANFQPVMINVDSSLGDIWNKQYNIDFLPSILFANASGIEFERIKRIPTKEEFLITLKQIISKRDVPFRSHNHSRVVSTTSINNHSSEVIVDNPPMAKPVMEAPKSELIVETSTVKPAIESKAKNVVLSTGRDIQLGAFSTYEAAQKRLNVLTAFRQDNYIILQEESQGKLLYKVVHAGIVSDESSISMLMQYNQNGFEAFLRPK